MSGAQQLIFDEFKEWHITEGYQNAWFNDSFLSRFCRARKFDLDKIKLMFSAYMQYRRDNGLDTIVNVSVI